MIQIFYASHEFSISIKYFFKLYISSYFIVRLVVNNIIILIYHSPHTSIYTTTGNQMAPIIFASTLKPRPLHQKKENRWSQVNHFEIRLCSLPNSQTLIRKVYFPLSQPNTIHRCYCVCKRMKSWEENFKRENERKRHHQKIYIPTLYNNNYKYFSVS